MRLLSLKSQEFGFLQQAVLVAAIGLIVYARVVLYGGFLFDDAEYVVNNPVITNVSSALTMADPRQVGYLSFAFNYAMGGESPIGYHLVNVLIHILNSLLVIQLTALLLKKFSRNDSLPAWASFCPLFTGLLFLVHPVQTQAVSYITQRFTSLATLFYLLAVWGYITARQRLEAEPKDRRGYGLLLLSFLATVAAMRTKEISFTIPVMLFLMEFALFNSSRFGTKRFLFPAILSVTLLIIPLSILGPELGLMNADDGIADVTRSDKLHDLTQRSPWLYVLTQFRVIVVYIRLLFLPSGLRVIYDFPVAKSLFEAGVVISFLCLAALAGAALYLFIRSRKAGTDDEVALLFGMVSTGIFWFFIALSVESSVVPIKDVIFEHRIYLPSAGFFWALSALVLFSLSRFMRSALRPVHVIMTLSLIILPLSIGTGMRNEVWIDEVKFWNDVVEKSPGKAMGYNNRAAARAKREDYPGALDDYSRAIDLFPKTMEALFEWENSDFSPWNMSKTYTGRGNVYLALGNIEKAREDFSRSKEVYAMPVDQDNLLVEADRYTKSNDYRKAIFIYDRILEWDPENLRALNDRANAYSFLKRFDEAVNDLTRVIALDPGFVIAYHNRGIAYAWSGKKERAISDFMKACDKGFEPACRSVEIIRPVAGATTRQP